MTTKYMRVVEGGDAPEGRSVCDVSIEGLPQPGEAPEAATTAKAGVVKMAAALTKVTVADATAAAGEAPTKAEFDALVALANACKAAINGNADKAKSAGQSA